MLHRAPACFATVALLPTGDLLHHVVQVAEGVSLGFRLAFHLLVGHEQDVRTHARLAGALAAAQE